MKPNTRTRIEVIERVVFLLAVIVVTLDPLPYGDHDERNRHKRA